MTHTYTTALTHTYDGGLSHTISQHINQTTLHPSFDSKKTHGAFITKAIFTARNYTALY